MSESERSMLARERQQNTRAWWVLASWWILCFVAVMIYVWTKAPTGPAIGITIAVGFLYTVAIGIPMYLSKP
ncbi:hypothetical protein [Streptomyces sp. SYSU K21746]